MRFSIGSLFFAVSLLQLSCAPDPEVVDGDGNGSSAGDGDSSGTGLGGDGSGGGSGSGGIPDGVMDDDVANEDSDADGYCFSAEAGYYPCDDGAPPGSGPAGIGDDVPGDGDGDQSGDGDGDDVPVIGDGDGDGDDEGGDGDGDGPVFPDDCTETVFSGENAQDPRILLVVDKSGSMDYEAVGYNGTKWNGAVDAISTVVDSLEDSVEFGLMMYPGWALDGNLCAEGDLSVSVGGGNANAISLALTVASPNGATPTAGTLEQAKTELDGLGASGGNRAVILATDGGPNCNGSLNPQTCTCTKTSSPCTGDSAGYNCLDDDGAVAAAQLLNDAGYSVFVVGIPGSENFTDVLNGLAEAGGTALSGSTKYYQADDTDSLSEAIESIANRVATCRFDVDFLPGQDMTVTVGGNEVSRDPNRTNGWDLVDVDTIELFGAACTDAMGGVDISVETCGSGTAG